MGPTDRLTDRRIRSRYPPHRPIDLCKVQRKRERERERENEKTRKRLAEKEEREKVVYEEGV